MSSTVKLKLKRGIYLDYLAYLFPPDGDGVYRVTTASDVGRVLVSYIAVADRPVEKVAGDDEVVVTLRLPDCDSTQNFRDKWLYISAGDEARLRGYIQAVFNNELMSYYINAIMMGYQKKEAIEMFCISRKLVTADPYEALHKRVYREEQRKLTAIATTLYNKVTHYERKLKIIQENDS